MVYPLLLSIKLHNCIKGCSEKEAFFMHPTLVSVSGVENTSVL